jgi:membrane protein
LPPSTRCCRTGRSPGATSLSGAVAAALPFESGKYLISFYIATSAVASSYGAAGALMVILLWIDYSAQIFLFGAEFTKAFSELYGSHAENPAR